MTTAADVDECVAAMAAQLSAEFNTRATGYVRTPASWRVVGGSVADAQGWHAEAIRSADRPCTVIRCGDAGSAVTTLLTLPGSGEPVAAVVLDGDLSAYEDCFRDLSSLASFALAAVRERSDRRRFEHDLVRAYALVRRLGRLGTVEHIAQLVVDKVAELLRADRVSLSLYTKTDDSLSIVATHGYPRERVSNVRVRPGDWVVGHVFSSRRPLFVSDVRLLPAVARHGNQYRTFSFAAVPLLTGNDTIGVLTVTDKRDGRAFDRHDELLLRSITVAAAISVVAARRESEAAQLAYAATTDSLSGLMNRQSLDHRLHQELERTRREGTSLAVLMMDVDEFKHINDTHGHQVGDAVLRAVGAVIRASVRVFDVCARYGGDEFAVVMPNCDHASAVACAERIRIRVSELNEHDGPQRFPGSVTLSIGVAAASNGETASDIVLRADRALYRAKGEGKNVVRSEGLDDRGIAEGPWPGLVAEASPAESEPVDEAAADRPNQLPYVLATDADEARIKLYLEAIKPFHCGLLVARSGALAAELIGRFGPPVLLIVDLQLTSGDAFSAIDALPDDAPTSVVAWSPSRDLREFAASRIRSGRVLSANASPASVMAALHGSLQQHRSSEPLAAPDKPVRAVEGAQELIEQVRRVCNAAGVAIYLKDDYQGYRLSFDWSGDGSLHPPVDLPLVFERVQRSGRTVQHHELHDVLRARPGAIRGIAGTPIRAGAHIIGVICVFDVNPLRLDVRTIAALEAVGLGAIASEPEGHQTDEHAAATATVEAPTQMGGRRTDSARPASGASGAEYPAALLDRMGGEFAVARERSRAKREGRQLSVVLFGLAARPATPSEPDDLPLDCVTETLLSAIRQSDLPIRWSANELVVVFAGLDTDGARPVAERVRAALTAGVRNRVAVAGGIEHVDQDASFPEVVDRARKKVANAVGQGLNRIV
jgi:diguanylate cyclase (GGDEF)-like protein